MRRLISFMMAIIAWSAALTAQTTTYHGTVLDASNNEPLIGATILPVGGGQGVAADVDGNFRITVPHGVTQAKISYVGFKDQVVKLTNNMVIYMQQASSNLDDLVVVAYGTANKESLTGSVAVVGSKEIEDRPVTSVTAALEGNAPGVQVTSATTQPGQAPAIRVRGFSSINGNNSALIVVDGSEYVGDIAALNPQDIESMSVLKDAASCALYGNRGANGVVLITTKKAKNLGKVDVTLQIRQGAYQRALPMYDRMNADQWMQATYDAQINGTLTNNPEMSRQEAIKQWNQTFIKSYADLNIYNAKDEEVFDSNGRLAASILPGYQGEDMNWWKGVSRTGYRQEYTANIAGATEKFDAFASAGYLKENGYVLLTDYERYSGRVNLNAKPVKYLKLGLNLSAAQQEMQRSPVDPDGLGYTNNPFSMTQNKAPIYPYYLHDEKGNVVYGSDGAPVWNTEAYNKDGNIVWNIREDRRNYSVTQVDASAYGQIILPYGFDVTVKGMMFRDKTNELQYNNNLIGSQANVGSLSQGFYRTSTSTFQQMLNWSQDYGHNHIDVLLDHENYMYKYDENYIRKSGQELDGLIHMSNFSEMMDMNAYSTEYKLESYLGRARYNWDQKYFGEVSLRRDGSSRFGKDDRWGTFWSVGASWIMSKEKFMESLTWVDYLKLRAAYGSVGNDASAGHYASWGIYYFGWSIAGSQSCLVPGQLPPTGLKWEATKTLDLALEGSLFNDRLTFSIGYYNKRNSDLLFWRSAAPSSGALSNTGSNPSILQNIGTMQNIGWELQFGVDIIRNADFKWNFNIDASFLKNKIVKLPDNQNIPGDALFMGKSLYEKYTYEWAGIDQTTGRSLYTIDPSSPDFYTYNSDNELVFNSALYESFVEGAAGNGELVEVDGQLYTYNTGYASRKIMGTALPTVYGSFGTNLSWKGINLGLLFQYSLGGKMYDGNYASLTGIGVSAAGALSTDLLNAWTEKPNGMSDLQTVNTTYSYVGADGQTVTKEVALLRGSGVIDPNGIPGLNTTYNTYNNSGSSRFLVNNNYLIFKNINLSYDLPSAWVKTMKMQNLNLGVTIDNVFIASRRKGLNPQYNFSGGQGQYFVPSRVYSFQLTAKF